jgi:hypothetical protein
MPNGLKNLGASCIRYLAEATAYWLLVTDVYPHVRRRSAFYDEPEPV